MIHLHVYFTEKSLVIPHLDAVKRVSRQYFFLFFSPQRTYISISAQIKEQNHWIRLWILCIAFYVVQAKVQLCLISMFWFKYELTSHNLFLLIFICWVLGTIRIKQKENVMYETWRSWIPDQIENTFLPVKKAQNARFDVQLSVVKVTSVTLHSVISFVSLLNVKSTIRHILFKQKRKHVCIDHLQLNGNRVCVMEEYSIYFCKSLNCHMIQYTKYSVFSIDLVPIHHNLFFDLNFVGTSMEGENHFVWEIGKPKEAHEKRKE